ncbi:MAG: hypothetical protein ABJI60_06085 [Kangiellaceae bacterium]
MSNGQRLFKAILLAPFASLLVLAVIFIESLFRGQGNLFVEGTVVALMFGFGFVSISFAFLILYGLPVHFIFTKLLIRHWIAYVGFGILGPVSYIFITHIGSEIPNSMRLVNYVVFGSSGLCVSLIFWLIAVKPNTVNQESQNS